MSVPKKKRTKGSVGKRRSHHYLKTNQLATCPECNESVLPHHACANCGSYKNRNTKKDQ